MGRDGAQGARAVRAAGGRIICEAAESCTVYGMPRAVVEDGLADLVLPLGELAAGHRRGGRCVSALPLIHDDYVAFCEGVRGLCEIDLLQYKRGQMERRVRSFAERRGHADLATYLRLLAGDAAARDEFLDRVTINVSNLWRNPEQWERLRHDVVPALAADGTLRAWSAGCSYGAEAYTLAAVCRLAAPAARTPRSSGPTSTAARSSAPSAASSTPRTSATLRPTPWRASSSPTASAGARAPSCARWSPSRSATC